MNLNNVKPRTSQWKQILVVLALILISLLVFAFFLRFSRINGNFRATFEGMLTGTANRPFVTRVLIPWLTTGTGALLPVQIRSMIENWIGGSQLLLDVLGRYHAPANLRVEALISIFWQYLSLLGYFFVFRALLKKIFTLSAAMVNLLSALPALGLLPLMFFGYIYDLPSLFLCTLLFYAIAANRRTLYFIVFTLALVNKETAAVLIIPSILLFWRPDHPKIGQVIKGVLIQVLIFLVVRVPIAILFRKNAGAFMEMHFTDHWKGLIQNPMYGVALLVLFACLFILLLYRWRQKPAVINLGLVSGMVLFVLFLIGGMPMEFRIFYEVMAAVILSVIHSLLMRWNRSPLLNSMSTDEFLGSIRNWIAEKKSNLTNKPTPSS